MQTVIFRQQHSDILQHLSALDRMAAAAPEQELCLELSRLAGVVKVHLALEDRSVYPALLEHENPQIRATAEKFWRTMGDLSAFYAAFHQRWVRHGAIAENRLGFIREFGVLRSALRQRIDLENRDLYDVADSMQNARLVRSVSVPA